VLVMARRCATQRGFTLAELMTVVTIVAIGAMVALPSLGTALSGQRSRAAATDLASSLLLARSEAIKRRGRVRIEPRTGSDWASGWRVVGVTEGDQLDRKDTLGDVTVARAPASIVYGRNGRLTATGVVRVEFADATQSPERTRCVTIDPGGLPRVAAGSCP
jgi:type IV fimbrial biogenesis protein FimT